MSKYTGIYRDRKLGVVVVGQDDDGIGTLTRLADLPIADAKHVMAVMMEQVGSGDVEGFDWYIDIDDWVVAGFSDGDGDPQGDGDGTGSGDGDGDGDGDPQGEPGDGDPQQGDSEPVDGDAMADAVMDNYSDRQDPDDLPIDHPLAQQIWELVKPNVLHHDQASARDLVQALVPPVAAAIEANRGTGGGSCDHKCSSGGVTIQVSDRAPAKIDGLTHHMMPKLAQAVAVGVPVMLVGPPGTGKTFMAQQICEAMGATYALQSFTPQTTESAIKGFIDANGVYRASAYRRVFDPAMSAGAEFRRYILDEGDNCSPPVLTGLNSGMANGYMEFPDQGVHCGDGFGFIMTANTWGTGPTAEFSGRAKLDPATLDRFVRIYIDTDESIEDAVVSAILQDDKLAEDWLRKVRHVRTAVEALGIKQFVTMRGSMNGAKLIRKGAGAFTTLEALQVTVLAGLSDDQQAKVKAYRG